MAKITPDAPRTTKILSRSIQRLSTNLSGARLRFTAETEFVKIKATLLTKNAMDNFSKNGEMGHNLFVDNRHWIPFYHPRKIDTTFHIQVKSPHYIEFYLPLYGNLNLKEIEVEGTIDLHLHIEILVQLFIMVLQLLKVAVPAALD